MTSTMQAASSAERWGPLWGARPDDWALSEEQHVPGYEAALAHVSLEPGQKVLDIGCGAGVFLALVAEHGAEPHGIDASESLVELARRRLPDADLRVGDMERLPYDDDTFDLVTGFTSFFFANDMVAALREAGRVAKPGAPVVAQVWGAHERCSLEAMKEIARPYMPPRPRCPTGSRLLAARDAGVARHRGRPHARADVRLELGVHVSGRGDARPSASRASGFALLVGPDHEVEARQAIVDGLARYQMPDGSYRLENEYRYLVARA